MPVHIPSPTGTRLLSFHMGPRPLVPNGDNLPKAITDFIDGANHKLDIAVQELESVPVAKAILRAKLERKVSVRIVIESDYLRASKKHEDPWGPVPA